MRKSWGLLPKITDGTKTIESRWYKNKSSPWGKIKKGEPLYFKNSGEGITVKAKVKEVLSFENLTPKIVLNILKEYGGLDGIKNESIPYFYNLFKVKKYCLLIFLKEIQKVKPFQINKKGFGSMSAWMCVDNINIINA